MAIRVGIGELDVAICFVELCGCCGRHAARILCGLRARLGDLTGDDQEAGIRAE
jgi:hypothetical protein